MDQRLQKFLANLGYGSRRYIENLIKERRIVVDGQVAELGCIVNNNSEILIDKKRIKKNNTVDKFYNKILIYHKPLGTICSRNDPQNRQTVFDDLPDLDNSRWISIGRLDLNTSGLLLFTTDGNFANKLMHPSSNIEREYLVRIIGELDDIKIHRLLSGVRLEDGMAKFKSIHKLNEVNKVNNWYKVIITEGRNREVRRLLSHVDCTVNKLIRIRFGDYLLPKDLKPGEYKIIDRK